MMAGTRTILSHTFLLSLLALSSGCVVHERSASASEAREEGYREGYYDRDHHRYYRDHSWHECTDHDAYCQ